MLLFKDIICSANV